VAAAARRLNTLVVDALVAHGLPALGFPGAALARADTSIEPDEAGGGARAIGPSASDETTGGTVRAVLFSSGSPVTNALAAGLLPVIYGDVVPAGTGAAICSTESLFLALLEVLPAQRVVLATDVDGVLDESGALVRILAPGHTNAHSLAQVGARVPDVTGGMAGKVRAALEMIETCPEVHVAIVNGLVAGRIRDAMMGRAVTGTVVAAALTGADA
jgi:isopentenyl phosphate kinase